MYEADISCFEPLKNDSKSILSSITVCAESFMVRRSCRASNRCAVTWRTTGICFSGFYDCIQRSGRRDDSTVRIFLFFCILILFIWRFLFGVSKVSVCNCRFSCRRVLISLKNIFNGMWFWRLQFVFFCIQIKFFLFHRFNSFVFFHLLQVWSTVIMN